MTQPRRVPSSGAEKVPVFVSADSDPTSATIGFAFVDELAVQDDPAGYTAGAWVSGSWDAGQGRAEALSPTVGAATATIPLTEGVTYRMHTRITTVDEVIDREVGRVFVT